MSDPIIEIEDGNWQHPQTFAGKPIERFDPEQGLQGSPSSVAVRIGLPPDVYEEIDTEQTLGWIRTLAADPGASAIEALTIGQWDFESDEPSTPVIQLLCELAPSFPALRALYLGDVVQEENEMSWISQGDCAPLLTAYPKLEHLRVRGPGQGYSDGEPVGELESASLRSLCFQTGGLAAQVVERVMTADLPALEHLELWMGQENYGANATPETLVPLLSGKLFPKLHYLGLRNSDRADAFAEALATAPILERIEALDLSLGTLTDAGANALLASPAVKTLQRLDLHHHFVTPPVVERLAALGIEQLNADPGEPQSYGDGDEVHRFTAVGE